ncbi:SGNH/GDSL hydrolase family protein [uncultured Sunxiuqinia sp.]|uniref:SGNH/GDSL hydrolase family protein n=1 Tax=uncultured Sunxiuqinia sp. TaxID=1573825 RepID=UPI002AA89426|nr:SGNH/GDSL hydrolase family protein [uncultured Sunxiuqinia sp.]
MGNLKNLFYLISFLFFAVNTSCTTQQADLKLNYSNPQIRYEGRIDTSNVEGAELYWSGTSVKINFEGESISALMSDENGTNDFNIQLDEDSTVLLQLDTVKRYYTLASGLAPGKHTLKLFKRTEWDRGTTTFYGFKIEGNAQVLPKSPAKKRKIEFYGNSITAGYAVEDTTGKDRPSGTFTNNYLSYAAITARHFDARYHCICKSGIGIMISWFPSIMSDIYDRLNPADSASQWDFSSYTPDLVVINLFQNDSWLVNRPERDEFKANFGSNAPNDEYIIQAYQSFVAGIRDQYPQASIICMLGNMDATRTDSQWPGYIEQAVFNLDDPKIYSFFMPFKETPGHPSIEEQQAMANRLIRFIDEHIEW